ncbi:concanavalin A-like lectin/glucanase domain-containing protein [Phyllosticta citribraziliensis]|uniref:Concanavalin A-like lectin/glucanase domain-containing protein n=1 Tax=Phyllosticta citribraziliensis TaxID=989973 RepID=A0ABR1M034_9PEZI
MQLYQLAVIFGLVVLPPLSTAQLPNPPCNPMKAPQQSPCPLMPGLNNPRKITFDFAHEAKPATVGGWNALNNSSGVAWTKDGAEFTVSKRGDRPTIELDSYIWYGRVDVEMQAAKGSDVLNAISIVSDTGDEINWQMSGSELRMPKSGYAGQGVQGRRRDHLPMSTSTYDNEPIYHTYSIDWSEERIQWEVDNEVVRTMVPQETSGGAVYPQTPSRVRIGVTADGGAAVNASATAPLKMYVRKVMVKNDYHSQYYEFVDRSGKVGSSSSSSSNNNSSNRHTLGAKKPKGGLFNIHKFDSFDDRMNRKHNKHHKKHDNLAAKSTPVRYFEPTGIHEFDSPSELSRPNHQHLKAPLSNPAAGLAVPNAFLPLLVLGGLAVVV